MANLPLSEFIDVNRDELIGRCRAKVATRSPPPTDTELSHGVPLFLKQLSAVLNDRQGDTTEINTAATQHGRDLLVQGYTVSQVVHDYGDVCQSISDMAVERRAPISTEDFRTLNRCLDDAIAGAVTAYGRGHEPSADQGAAESDELRDEIIRATIAFDVLKSGHIGVGRSTGAVLHRSLARLTTLIANLPVGTAAHRKA